MLLFADRANMVEGLGADLMRGHVPNVCAEMGGKAEFTYNRQAAIQKAVVVCAVVGLGFCSGASPRAARKTGGYLHML